MNPNSNAPHPSQQLTSLLKIRYPILCGAMYPCSNPELVAAASESGGIGIVQPISLLYVHGSKDYRQGLKRIRELTQKPYGMNVLTEQSSKVYLDRMRKWVDIALEEGCRFFVTALGNPRWIVERVKPLGGIVFHDVTEKKWALKALDAGVDGFICVNRRAGGHAGTRTAAELIDDLKDIRNSGKLLIAAGGISTPAQVREVLELGYAGVQLGTRFIASQECTAHADYKNAILRAHASDIVLTEKITGVPVAVIRSPSVERLGLKASPVSKWLLKQPRFKHWMRLWYTLRSSIQLKHASLKGYSYQDFWQAGQSVEGIDSIEPVAEIMKRLGEATVRA